MFHTELANRILNTYIKEAFRVSFGEINDALTREKVVTALRNISFEKSDSIKIIDIICDEKINTTDIIDAHKLRFIIHFTIIDSLFTIDQSIGG